MGFLSKITGGKSKENKQSEVKPKKRGKEKKSLFGGKKKEVTLLERMQLEESVAAASLDVVQELAEFGDSAVRELDEGLLIVAVTNEMLEEAGLDPAGEEFGSFAQALRSETIESIALADDLAAGVIGIIPSQETLVSLDEFDFAHDMAFRWALVPFDLSDDDRLTVLDSDIHIERLVEIANNQNIQLSIKNGEVIETEGDGYQASHVPVEADGVEDDGFDHGFDEEESFDDEELDAGGVEEPDELEDADGPDAEFDDAPDEAFDEDFDNNFEDPSYEEEAFEDNGVDEELASDPEFEDMDDDMDLEYEEEEGLTAEESKEAISRVVSHGFNNTELDLSIDMTKFDDYFNSVSIAQFDTTRADDSELQNVLSKLRQDANVELERFHQDNVQSLRNKFTTSMRNIHNKLVESLDHKDENTTYGRRHHEIEANYEDAMDDLDRQVAGEIQQINTQYNEAREEYAENAKREAMATYDSRYRDERNRKIENVKDNVQSELKTNRDTELGELYSDRRTVAQRLFDKAMTALLQHLQEEYQTISQKELQMYDAFRKSMDVYLRKHFADEVLRAKAEAEKLKQSHEAERVRRDYEQMLLTKARQIEETDKQSREAIRQLEDNHKEQINHVQKDYERRIEREQRENQNLREMLQDANASNSKIGEQKDKEVEHRMNMYKDALEAKEKELEYANERANKAQKPMRFVLGAVATVTLAFGIIAGFLFGANTVQLAPGEAQSVPQEDVVSFLDESSAEIVKVFDVDIAA
ncbi:hypothetical protein [Evansella clarkii]|uniref:hypothetical protein n=1 Tax=Evansella clarkii TaxID=79879 RepID=UPI0009984474|nr:hypothetical protein [Evansella clarkii]